MDTLKPVCYMFIAVDVLLLLILTANYLPVDARLASCFDRRQYHQLLLLLLLMLVDVNDESEGNANRREEEIN